MEKKTQNVILDLAAQKQEINKSTRDIHKQVKKLSMLFEIQIKNYKKQFLQCAFFGP